MDKLSGDKNTDMIILMKLNDYELSRVCSVNKYINSICENKNFWNTRIRSFFNVNENELEELRRYLHMDGKELYVYLVSKTIGFNYVDLLIIFLLKYQSSINEIIEKALVEKLPKYINKEELIYYLRGEIPKQILERRIINIGYPYSTTDFSTHDLSFPDIIKKLRVPSSKSMLSFLDQYIRKNIKS